MNLYEAMQSTKEVDEKAFGNSGRKNEMMITKDAEPKKFYEVECDKNLSIYNNCEYIGTINLWNANIFEIGESAVIKTVDSILESYDKNLFDNRFRNHMNLIMVDSETLNPEARLEYSIINNQAIAALIADDMYIVGYSEGLEV